MTGIATAHTIKSLDVKPYKRGCGFEPLRRIFLSVILSCFTCRMTPSYYFLPTVSFISILQHSACINSKYNR